MSSIISCLGMVDVVFFALACLISVVVVVAAGVSDVLPWVFRPDAACIKVPLAKIPSVSCAVRDVGGGLT